MRVRDSIALTLPSFFLRLVLGVTFVWAGTGKLTSTMQVRGDDAARLANLGVVLTPVDGTESDHLNSETDPADLPADEPSSTDEPTESNSVPETGDDLQSQANEIIEQIENAVENNAEELPADPPTPPTIDEPEVEAEAGPHSLGMHRIDNGYVLRLVQQRESNRVASDFPEPVSCKRVYSIALMISKAADPGLTEDSQPISPIMPPKLATGSWPILLAWTAAITELVAGAFLLLGLLTRISAIGTATVMGVALWMTQFGPAAMHSSDAILGFIPRHADLFSPASYSTLLWQLALGSMSLAVLFLGSGAIGLDRVFFRSSSRDPYLHGDPKDKKQDKRQDMNPAIAQRNEFDRGPSS